MPPLQASLQAALVAAYGRRVQRLVALLQQYEARLQQALAALGLPQQHGQGTQSAESASLSDHLHHLEQQLAAALDATGGAGPTADALLCLVSGAPAAADVAGAGPGAILAQLQGELRQGGPCAA